MRKRSASSALASDPIVVELQSNVIVVGEDKPIAFAVKDDEVVDGETKRFKGIRKSGKIWKTRQKDPISSVRNGKAFHTSWKEKQAKKAELDHVRDQERQRKQEIEDRNTGIRERRQEKMKRRAANEKKSETVQALNPKKLRQKLKTMSKKQKRQIRKTTVSPL